MFMASSCTGSSDPKGVDMDRFCELTAPRGFLLPTRELEDFLDEVRLRVNETAAVAPPEIRSSTEQVADLWKEVYDQAEAVDFDAIRWRDEPANRATLDRLVAPSDEVQEWSAANCVRQ
jgi:hypothetical protein